MELQLKNIGMIKEANVKIDGLTVIAGENDTGKSTLGKALFAILQQHVDKTFGKNFPLSKIQLSSCSHTKHVIFVETPVVWNLQELFRSSSDIESHLKVIGESIDIPYPFLMKDLYFKLMTELKRSDNWTNSIKNQFIEVVNGEFKKDIDGIYKFHRGEEKFDLDNVATGIKTFGILQVLLDNNRLNKDTVLVLDEPEVHLHPKWQLEMAKIIVELVKNGVKIVVNSHSPYMIEALELFSSKQKINSNFYLAEKKNNYAIISDVTANLEPIYSKLAEPIQDLEDESLENFKW